MLFIAANTCSLALLNRKPSHHSIDHIKTLSNNQVISVTQIKIAEFHHFLRSGIQESAFRKLCSLLSSDSLPFTKSRNFLLDEPLKTLYNELCYLLRGSGSAVEQWLPKPKVAGSNPVFRFSFNLQSVWKEYLTDFLGSFMGKTHKLKEEQMMSQTTNGAQHTRPQHIQTIIKGTLNKTDTESGCGKCQTSCQSACKTSCTVSNQVCER